MKGMVTDEEMRQVIDTATNFILAFLREANAHGINEKTARIHVSGTLAFLAVESERLGVYSMFDDLIHEIVMGEPLRPVEA